MTLHGRSTVCELQRRPVSCRWQPHSATGTMGIVIEADEVLDKSRLGSSVGPTVLFNSFTESTAEWKGSVALAVNMPEEEAQKVIIAYGVGSSASKDVGGNVIASLAGWSVVRCAHLPPCCQKCDGPSRPADITPPQLLAAPAPLLSTTASTAPCPRTSHIINF